MSRVDLERRLTVGLMIALGCLARILRRAADVNDRFWDWESSLDESGSFIARLFLRGVEAHCRFWFPYDAFLKDQFEECCYDWLAEMQSDWEMTPGLWDAMEQMAKRRGVGRVTRRFFPLLRKRLRLGFAELKLVDRVQDDIEALSLHADCAKIPARYTRQLLLLCTLEHDALERGIANAARAILDSIGILRRASAGVEMASTPATAARELIGELFSPHVLAAGTGPGLFVPRC